MASDTWSQVAYEAVVSLLSAVVGPLAVLSALECSARVEFLRRLRPRRDAAACLPP